MFFTPKLILVVALFLAVSIPANAQAGSESRAQAVHTGQQVYTQKCFQCHSVVPDQVRFGPSLYGELNKPHPRKTDVQVRTILENGKGKMPSFKDALSQQDTDNLLAYLHSLPATTAP